MPPDLPSVLIIIDVQNDFCPGGSLAVPEGDQVVPVVNRLMEQFEHAVLTQDWHPPGHKSFASSHPDKQPFDSVNMPYGTQTLWPDHCVQGSRGAEFHPRLTANRAELVIRKGYRPGIDSYSAFFENDQTTPTGLAGYLTERGLTRLVMVGLAYDVCVRFSALDARRLGFDVTLIRSGCQGIDRDGSTAAATQAMNEAGVSIMADAT